VRRTGLREAYVAMDCLRGAAPPNMRRHPANARNYILAYAVPYVWLMPREVIERGAHLIIASTPRIPEVCVNPRAKNFHWADMTQGLFEAQDKCADNPVLLDFDGHPVESPEDLLDLLVGDRVGRQVTIRARRGGAVVDLAITVGERPVN